MRSDQVRSDGSNGSPVASSVGADWRLERMRLLVADADLGGDWNPEAFLLTPHPGGRISGRECCVVAECPLNRHGAGVLCRSHALQMGQSDVSSIEAWVATGEPRRIRRRCSPESCLVADDTGRCSRPPADSSRLCHAHGAAWERRERAGGPFAEFLAGARPLPGFGSCVVASCFLEAAYKAVCLCDGHYRSWRRHGRPAGRRFQDWAARAPQPATGRVLSLRGLPELVRLELLYGIDRRAAGHIRARDSEMRVFADQLRATDATSVTEFKLADFKGNDTYAHFAAFVIDRVRLAYADPEVERHADIWDLRLFGRCGHIDFTGIRQDWLREATKAWAATAAVGVRSESTLQHRVHAVVLLSSVLASGPGGGHDPEALGRADIDRFLVRRASLRTRRGQPYSASRATSIVRDCALVLREAREMGLVPNLGSTFAFRRGDTGPTLHDSEVGRALPDHVVACLDAHLDLLRAVPGYFRGTTRHGTGVLGERSAEMAVLIYRLLKGTGRRAGELASLRLDCLDVDEHGRPVLVYDNHKAARMGRRLPLSDSELVEAISAQQAWVTDRFPTTARDRLWLLPRPNQNTDGLIHLRPHQIFEWIRQWVTDIPHIDGGPVGAEGQAVAFDRSGIHPHAFRHTYAQTMADQGVPAPVLRDLMDHRSIDTTMGYFRVGETKKREAMDVLARHTVDNRGTTRHSGGGRSRSAALAEQLSWVAVPMGKCSEPTNVRAGGQACPIRYQCTGCPHFESDPSYLPNLSTYADDLRREREAMTATGAADWLIEGVTRQLDVVVDHIRTHQQLLAELPDDQRHAVEEAAVILRRARQSVPVAFGQRRSDQWP